MESSLIVLERKWQGAISVNAHCNTSCWRSPSKHANVCPWQNASALHIHRDLFRRCWDCNFCAALHCFARPEVVPNPLRQNNLPTSLSCKQWCYYHSVSDHILVIDRIEALVLRRIKHQRAKRRGSIAGVTLEGSVQVWHQLHPPTDDLAAASFKILPMIEQLTRVVELAVNLLPGRTLHVPAVDLRQRREHHTLQAPNQVFLARGLPNLGAP